MKTTVAALVLVSISVFSGCASSQHTPNWGSAAVVSPTSAGAIPTPSETADEFQQELARQPENRNVTLSSWFPETRTRRAGCSPSG